MSAEQNKVAVELYYLILNQGRLDMLDTSLAPGFVHHLPGLPPGRNAFKQMLYQYRLGFRDMTTAIQKLLMDGEHVVAHTLTRGTHTGDFLGHPPTGKTFVAPSIEIFRVDGNCLTERWGVFDTVTMLHQLGLYQPMGVSRAPV